jgi:hypothetical protein
MRSRGSARTPRAEEKGKERERDEVELSEMGGGKGRHEGTRMNLLMGVWLNV